ncbi:MAG: nucleotide-binding universal stress UspA family protein [Candidatus Endobugula sp.]|jgi:nucleotide-binding universal stress UspA family protein
MNKGIKKVLVPVDFSENSEVAMQTALEYFGNKAVTITILSVYEGSEKRSDYNAPNNEVDEMMAKSALIQMTRFVKLFEAGAKSKNAIIETEIYKGNPDKEIIDTAKAKRCDLIIMGSQGRGSTLKSMFFGGTTYQVSRKAHCSVMVIRQ